MATLREVHVQIQALCKEYDTVPVNTIARHFNESPASIISQVNSLKRLGIVDFADGETDKVTLTEWGKLWNAP